MSEARPTDEELIAAFRDSGDRDRILALLRQMGVFLGDALTARKQRVVIQGDTATVSSGNGPVVGLRRDGNEWKVTLRPEPQIKGPRGSGDLAEPTGGAVRDRRHWDRRIAQPPARPRALQARKELP